MLAFFLVLYRVIVLNSSNVCFITNKKNSRGNPGFRGNSCSIESVSKTHYPCYNHKQSAWRNMTWWNEIFHVKLRDFVQKWSLDVCYLRLYCKEVSPPMERFSLIHIVLWRPTYTRKHLMFILQRNIFLKKGRFFISKCHFDWEVKIIVLFKLEIYSNQALIVVAYLLNYNRTFLCKKFTLLQKKNPNSVGINTYISINIKYQQIDKSLFNKSLIFIRTLTSWAKIVNNT